MPYAAWRHTALTLLVYFDCKEVSFLQTQEFSSLQEYHIADFVLRGGKRARQYS